MFKKLIVLMVMCLPTTLALASNPHFDPICQESVRSGFGITMEADNVIPREDGALMMDFGNKTILITPDAILPSKYHYLKETWRELDRGYTPVGAIVGGEEGMFVTITVGLDYMKGVKYECVTIKLQPYSP